MSTAVEINGVTLVPIKEAAVSVSYSRDYVARLAREGKIVASQIGRQWFVDLVSLRDFSTAASAFEEVRKEELRSERKRELMAKECLASLDSIAAQRIRSQRFDALVVTTAVVCLGIFTGLGLYTASLVPSSKLASLSYSVLPQAKPATEVATVATSPFKVIEEPKDTLLLTTVVERPVFTQREEVTPLEGGMAGVLVFSSGTSVAEASDVEQLFSDEVEAHFTSPDSGVILYEGEAGEVVEYPFVAIPPKSAEVKAMNE
jgi:hypothetical protein